MDICLKQVSAVDVEQATAILPFLERALEKGGNKDWDLFDVIRLSLEGKVSLWAVVFSGKIIGAGATGEIALPKRKIFEVLLFSANDDTSWIDVLPQLKAIAAESGAGFIRGCGRPGWKKRLKATDCNVWELEV